MRRIWMSMVTGGAVLGSRFAGSRFGVLSLPPEPGDQEKFFLKEELLTSWLSCQGLLISDPHVENVNTPSMNTGAPPT